MDETVLDNGTVPQEGTGIGSERASGAREACSEQPGRLGSIQLNEPKSLGLVGAGEVVTEQQVHGGSATTDVLGATGTEREQDRAVGAGGQGDIYSSENCLE